MCTCIIKENFAVGLWQCHYWNRGKKIVAMPFTKYGKKNNLWQTNCGCGNGIAKIGGKNCDKLIVAMALLKMGEKNVVPKFGEE